MGPTIDQRLAQQNDGVSWRDCNEAGMAHLWLRDQVPNYWRCARCPVATRHEEDGFKPLGFLGGRPWR